jgi:hypothetical protein
MGLNSLFQPFLGQFFGDWGFPVDYRLLQLVKDRHFILLRLLMSAAPVVIAYNYIRSGVEGSFGTAKTSRHMWLELLDLG